MCRRRSCCMEHLWHCLVNSWSPRSHPPPNFWTICGGRLLSFPQGQWSTRCPHPTLQRLLPPPLLCLCSAAWSSWAATHAALRRPLQGAVQRPEVFYSTAGQPTGEDNSGQIEALPVTRSFPSSTSTTRQAAEDGPYIISASDLHSGGGAMWRPGMWESRHGKIREINNIVLVCS